MMGASTRFLKIVQNVVTPICRMHSVTDAFIGERDTAECAPLLFGKPSKFNKFAKNVSLLNFTVIIVGQVNKILEDQEERLALVEFLSRCKYPSAPPYVQKLFVADSFEFTLKSKIERMLGITVNVSQNPRPVIYFEHSIPFHPLESIPPWTQFGNPIHYIPLQPPAPIPKDSHAWFQEEDMLNVLTSGRTGDPSVEGETSSRRIAEKRKEKDLARVSKGADHKRRRSAEASESSSKRLKGATVSEDNAVISLSEEEDTRDYPTGRMRGSAAVKRAKQDSRTEVLDKNQKTSVAQPSKENRSSSIVSGSRHSKSPTSHRDRYRLSRSHRSRSRSNRSRSRSRRSHRSRSRSNRSRSRSRRSHRSRSRSPRSNRSRSRSRRSRRRRSRSSRSSSASSRSHRSRSRSRRSNRSRLKSLRSNRNRSSSPVLRKSKKKRGSRVSDAASSSPAVVTSKPNLVPYRNSNSVSPERLPSKNREKDVAEISSPSSVTSMSDDEVATSKSTTKETVDKTQLLVLLKLSSQHYDKPSLGKQLGEKLLKKFEKQERLICSKLEEEFEVYRAMPDMYDRYEVCYENFMEKYLLKFPDENEEHKDRLWTEFWKSKFEYVKKCELERRILNLVKEYRTKNVLASPSTNEEIDSSLVQIPSSSLKEVTKGKRTSNEASASLTIEATSGNSKPKTSTVKKVVGKRKASNNPKSFTTSQSNTEKECLSTTSKASSSSASEQKGRSTKDGNQEKQIPRSNVPPPTRMSTRQTSVKALEGAKENIKSKVNIKDIALKLGKVVSLLESMIPELGLLGHSITGIMSKIKDLGKNTKNAVKVFTDAENIELVEMAMNKIKVKYAEKGKSNLLKDMEKNIKQLMEYSKPAQTVKGKAPQTKKQKPDLNIQAIAINTKGKDAASIFKVIQSAATYEGLTLGSEEMNKIFLEVCSSHLQMTEKKVL